MGKGITKKQQAVLDCIQKYITEKGYGPSVRDVCAMLGLSSPSTVHVHLKALEDKGFIKKDAQTSRSITLVNSPHSRNVGVIGAADYNIIELPLVGDVAAGAPILAEENITNRISLPTEIVGDSASFLLSVHGDSMIEAGINDGDYVVVRQQNTANNGEIVVAMIEGSATVKRFYRENGHFRLQPENNAMLPIITRSVDIAGKVVTVYRKY